MLLRKVPVRLTTRKRFRAAPLLLLGLAMLGTAAFPAAAQAVESAPTTARDLGTLSLEELLDIRIEKVYSASKYEQQVTRAPAAVTIITADEITKFGYQTLADALQSVRGVYVTNDRNYAYLGMRGFARPGDYNSRALLLVDGHQLNDDLYGSALIGTEGVIDLDLVERIEVIRGPSSSIYGTNAFFGVINLITRKPADIGGLETSLEGGTHATYKTRVTFGRQYDKDFGLLLSGSVYHTDGQPQLYFPEFDTPENNHGVADRADADRAQNWLARLTFKQVTFSAAYSRRDKHVPTAQFDSVFNDARHVTTDATFFADLKYAGELSPNWQMMTRLYYDHYHYEGTYPYAAPTPNDPQATVLNFDDANAKCVGAEFQLTGKLFDRHTIVLGAAHREDLHITQANYDEDPWIDYLNLDQSASSSGLYAQGEFAVRSDLRFSAGLRLDHFSEFGNALNPRLGLIYNPSPAATFKLLYGTAYRAPNSYEHDYYFPDYNKANPRLEPEIIRTGELVYEHYLGHGLHLGISGYQYDIDDLINQQLDPQDGLAVFENSGSVTARGVEIELEGRYAHGLMARVSYATQRAEDSHTGIALNNSPRHLAKLNALVPIAGENIFAGVELQYLSRLETLAGNWTDDFMLANLTLHGRMLNGRCELSATVNNVLDTDYAYPGSVNTPEDAIPQNGRSFWFKLTYRY